MNSACLCLPRRSFAIGAAVALCVTSLLALGPRGAAGADLKRIAPRLSAESTDDLDVMRQRGRSLDAVGPQVLGKLYFAVAIVAGRGATGRRIAVLARVNCSISTI